MKRIPLLLLLILLLFSFAGCSDRIDDSFHKVVFDDGSGGSTIIQYVLDGKTAAKPSRDPVAPEEAKKGRFRAWVLKSGNGTEVDYDFSQPVKSDLHLYAEYLKAYTVSYYSTKTTLYEEETVSAGDKAVAPASSPVVPGYGTLEGWGTDPENPRTTKYDFNEGVTSNLNLYAYYREIKYVTLLDPDGKEIGERIKVSYLDILPVPDITECGTKLIEKWQIKTSDGYTDYDFTSPVEKDITLKAVCYDAIKDTTPVTTGDVLSTMKFALSLSACTEYSTGDDTTSGFRNSDLIKIFLSSSRESINTGNLNLRYLNDGVSYELYIPGENLNVPEHLLYYEIVDTTSSETDAKRFYSRSDKDGGTEVEAEDFTINVNLAPGKLEDGRVVKNGDFFNTGTTFTSLFKSIKLKLDKDGNIDLVYSTVSEHCTFSMTNEHTDTSTVSTFIINRIVENDKDHTGSGAVKMTFYTVTFDPANGEAVTKVNLLGSESTIVNKPDGDPRDSLCRESFRYWTKNGVEYDFTSKIVENTVLEAAYYSNEDFRRVLQAECMYKAAVYFSYCGEIYTERPDFDDLFPDADARRNLGAVLLSTLFSIDEKSEKLYLTYDNEKHDYEDNMSGYEVYRISEATDIKKNSSGKSEDGKTKTIAFEDFALALQFKNNKGQTVDLKETFSIDAAITEGTEATVTTVVLKAGEKTYSKLTAEATKLSDGKTEVVFEYEGLRFRRIY